MQEQQTGSQWDIIMTVLIEGKKYINIPSYRYRDELSTIGYLDQSSNVSECLSTWLAKLNEPRPRSVAISQQYRNIGNERHSDNEWTDDIAADYYTQAIFSAPKNSVEAALAHANRAASFCRMASFHEEGYWDCVQAIKLNYPQNKLCKLLHRKINFCQFPRNESRLIETLQQLEELSKKNIFTEKELNLVHLKKQLEDYNVGKDVVSDPVEEVPTIIVQNKTLIEKMSSECGRFIIAGEPIENNEPIYREKAFAFVPVYNDYRPNAIFYHCQNCAQTNCQPFPCYDCCRASYCTPKCYDEHRSIHKYECAGYQKNLWMKIGIAHLAMRNFLIGFPTIIDKIKHLKGVTPAILLDALNGVNDLTFAYGDILKLVTNFDKMEVEDCLRYALTAKMLTIYLSEHTQFFAQLSQQHFEIMSSKDNWKKFVAAIILKHIGQLVSNGHAISDMELVRPSDFDHSYLNGRDEVQSTFLNMCMSSTRIFTAIFPKISLLNHSCDPNIRNSFDGPFLTIHAARNIALNEEIFNCYGPNYKLMDRDERKNILMQQYCFECKCNKCLTNDTTVDQYYDYKCSNENCQAIFSLDTVDKQWWHNADNDRLCDTIMKAFVCKKCNRRLPLNPKNYQEFIKQNIKCERNLRPDDVTKWLTNYYFSVADCLSKNHELKQRMASIILQMNINAKDADIFLSLAYIAIDNFVATRERFGIYSMEFVMATTHALVIIENIKKLKTKKKLNYRNEIEKIKKILNMKQIKCAYTILSKSTQNIFKNYIAKIESDNRDVSKRLHDLDLGHIDGDDSDENDYV